MFESRFTSHDANQMKGLHSGLFLHMESHWMWSNPQWDIRTFSPGWNYLLFFLGSTSGTDFHMDRVLQNPVCALDVFYIRVFPNFDAGWIVGKKEGCVWGHVEIVYSFFGGNLILSNSKRDLHVFVDVDETSQMTLINISLCCAGIVVEEKDSRSVKR